MPLSPYPYFSEDIFNQKISYSYSQFKGIQFIDEWRNYRYQFLQRTSAKKPEELNRLLSSSIDYRTQTEAMFSQWIGDAIIGDFDHKKMNLLVKRFEVTKKIYGAYDTNLRALDKQDYQDKDNYLKFGYLLVLYYGQKQYLPYLNALLKLNDILCSISSEFSELQRLVFAFLLRNEIGYVENLMQTRITRTV